MSSKAEPNLVLVVDDDPEIREGIAMILRDEGLRVLVASNGQDALAMLRTGLRPGLVLTDLMMPVLDGWEFRQSQKADPTLAAVPVVAISASGQLEDVAVRKAFDGWLAKPFEFERLLDVVAMYVAPRSRHPRT